jgi:phosphatidylethanolamine-binding protein (PEBP) family uncharacterized protein
MKTRDQLRFDRLSFIGVATLASLLAAGCGDDGNAKTTSPDSATMPADSAAVPADSAAVASPEALPIAKLDAASAEPADTSPVQPSTDTKASGPVACSSQADCTAPGACPPDAILGCACAATPTGNMCVPKCLTTNDCPKPVDQLLTCSAGICVPGADIRQDASPTTADTRVEPPVPDAGAVADTADAKSVAPETSPKTDAPVPPDLPPPPAKDGGAAGPVSCTSNAECTAPGVCPKEAALGCACSTSQGNTCVPKCSTASDCPKGAEQTCSNEGFCVPSGGPDGDGGPKGGPDGGGGSGHTGMNTDDTVSDQAQSMTIAFDGLAFVTGSFCAQTFYPPGKVADFFGFQYLRDNDPTNLGHNTEFTTLTADPVLAMLTEAQLTTLTDLGNVDAPLGDQYGLARFPLAMAFRRLFNGEAPSGHPALDVNAVKAYSAYLFGIDGQMSYARAVAYASVLNSMNASQKAKLDAMKGTGAGTWTQPEASAVGAILQKHPSKGDLRTYAGEMLAWYLGGTAPDVYFCPERQGTYFGSFFMKDVKAMHNPNYTIDSNMTADMGNSFLAALTPTQQSMVTGLVTTQKTDLVDIVAKRTLISDELRKLLSAGTVNQANVLSLSERYGELDGEISYFYATAFSGLGLTAAQKTTLTALRKTATAEADGSADYDSQCGNGYLYSAPLKTAPTVINTDFMFGVCSAQGTSCTSDWDCCSYACVSGACSAQFGFESSAFSDGGTLPVGYTCDGSDGMTSPNPALAWSGVPSGTAELALTMTTIALDGTKYNWVLFHIPASTTSLVSGTTVGTAGVSTDGPDLRYYPPCSIGPGEKTYTFTLYALSAAPTFSVPESLVTGPVLEAAIAPLTLASRQLNVSYTRQ